MVSMLISMLISMGTCCSFCCQDDGHHRHQGNHELRLVEHARADCVCGVVVVGLRGHCQAVYIYPDRRTHPYASGWQDMQRKRIICLTNCIHSKMSCLADRIPCVWMEAWGHGRVMLNSYPCISISKSTREHKAYHYRPIYHRYYYY